MTPAHRLVQFFATCLSVLAVPAIAGDSLWNEEALATIGPKSNIVECALVAVPKVERAVAERKDVLWQYNIVQISLTAPDGGVIRGDARRTSPSAATIAFYGKGTETPKPYREAIKTALPKLKSAVESTCRE